MHTKIRFHSGKSLGLLALTALALGINVCIGCSRNPVQTRDSYFQRGKVYLQEKKYADAAIEFQNAAKVDPHFAPAYYYLGLTEKQRGNWASAFRAFSKEVEITPNQTPGEIELANLYLMAHQPAKAGRLASDVLKREPRNFSALLIVADSDLGQKKYGKAVKELDTLKSMRPTQSSIYLAIGIAQLGSGDYSGAELSFREGIQLNPSSAEGYLDLANLYQKMGRLPQAENTLGEGLAATGNAPDMYFALADFYCRGGHLLKAEAMLASFEKTQRSSAHLYSEIGDFWFAHNELHPALAEYQAAYNITPSLLLEKKVVNTFITLDNVSEAASWNQQILKSNPNDPQGLMFSGAIAQLRGDNATAIARLKQVLENDPTNSVFAHYYLGMAYMATSQNDQAKSEFLACLKTAPTFSFAFLRLAQLSLRKRNAHDASQYARDVIRLDPAMVDGYLVASDAAVLSGDTVRADEALALADHFSPGSPAVVVREAILDGLRKNYAKAESEYQSVLGQVKDPTPILAGLAQVYVEQKETQKAIQEVSFYTSGPEANSDLFVLLAQLHVIQNDLGTASQDCQHALRLNPQSASAYFYLGRIAQIQGNDSVAIENYAYAGQLSPNESLPFMLAGELSQKLMQWTDAEKYYQTALQAAPGTALAQAGLARAMIELGQDSNVALGLAQQARSSAPDDPTVADDLGWVYLKKGVPQLAIPLLRQAVGKMPQDASFHFHLGMAYAAAGDKPAARLALLDARKLGLAETQARQAEQTLVSLSVPPKSR
jgi:tetratricopeptide (TPR) repeat protein